MIPLVAIPVAYLLGAVPWGLLVGKMAGGVDVRQYGSGHTGMTNVLRTVGVVPAAVVLLGDLAKGAGAVLFARLLSDSHMVEVGAALAALMGHNWSAFIRLQGGRGIAPAWGALFVLAYPAALAAALVGLPAIALTRYVSLGSVLGVLTAIAATVVLVVLGSAPGGYLAFLFIGGALILFRHRDNIQRLLHGTERSIGQPPEAFSGPQDNPDNRG